MKKILLGTVGLLALTATASAADLAARPYTKAPPPVMQAMYDWSGFYIGANGGYGSRRSTWDYTGAGTTFIAGEGSHDADGGFGGGQIGYRWQTGTWVWGVEAQGDYADLRGSNNSNISTFNNETRLRAFGLFTGSLGYAWNNTLLYVKGGAAVTDNRYRTTGFGAFTGVTGQVSDTRWGATVGGGVEFGFSPNWSFAVEYDHIFTDSRNYTFNTGAGVLIGRDNIRGDVDLISAKINYRWGGPIVARY